MAVAKLTSFKIYAYISSSWEDISADVVNAEPIACDWGIGSGDPLDRTADIGGMTFALNNSTQKYSPSHASALAGWKKGVPIKLEMVYDGVTYIRFRGTVDDIKITPGTKGERIARVSCVDWLDFANKYPLTNPGIRENKRADQALEILIPRVPIQPQVTSYDTGVNIFPALFDSVTTRTRAYTELNKLALSEMGYIYLRKDRANGEQLVFENANRRNGLRGLSLLPVPKASSGILLQENGDALLLETGDNILLNEGATFTVDNTMTAADVSYGDSVINRITARAYPKRVDTSIQVLYSLGSALAIGSAETKEFRGNYSDPTGGNTVNAISNSMVAPVATTDYLAFTNEDGTGTNITADIVVTATYGTEGVTYSIVNNSIYSGYITHLQARGLGVYSYNPIETSVEDSDSYNEHGYQNATIDQKYQRDVTAAKPFIKQILNIYKQPRTELNSITFNANRDSNHMLAFLNFDVGDIVEIKESQSGIDGWYYINGVEFQIIGKDIIMVKWILSLFIGYSLIIYSGEAGGDAINFGIIPAINNIENRTYTAWIKPDDSLTAGSSDHIMGTVADTGSFRMAYNDENHAIVAYTNLQTVSPGRWITANNTLPHDGDWYHVAISYNWTSTANDPIIYINGVAQSLTETNSPLGPTGSGETNISFLMGGVKTVTLDYPANQTFIGDIKDARVYNRILTPEEITQLYTDGAGADSVTNGLVFQAPAVNNYELAEYDDLTLTANTKILDKVGGVVGTPNGAPKSQLIP